jgi:Pyridoxamine 5'-phosphate oxidase
MQSQNALELPGIAIPAAIGANKEATTMTKIPHIYLDLLLQKKAFAHLATVMPDGSPQNTPVWFDYTAGKIRVFRPGGAPRYET